MWRTIHKPVGWKLFSQSSLWGRQRTSIPITTKSLRTKPVAKWCLPVCSWTQSIGKLGNNKSATLKFSVPLVSFTEVRTLRILSCNTRYVGGSYTSGFSANYMFMQVLVLMGQRLFPFSHQQCYITSQETASIHGRGLSVYFGIGDGY